MEALAHAAIWTLLLMVPCAALIAAGVLLWRRWRSVATAMIALGLAIQAIAYPEHVGHLWGDVPALLIVAAVLAFLMPRRPAGYIATPGHAL